MKNIRFKKNWNNKLNCRFFSTIRKVLPANPRYYLDKEGTVFNILMNQKIIGSARLIVIKEVKLGEIPEEILMLDTGLPPEEAMDVLKGFYKNNGSEPKDEDLYNILVFEALNIKKGLLCSTKR